MKSRIFITTCLMLGSLVLVAGQPNLPQPTDFTKDVPMLVSQWSDAFETLLDSAGMTPEQEEVIWRALNMSTVHLFDVQNPKDYDATTGEALRDLMDEVRAVLRQDQYIELLSGMPQTQWFLMAIQAVPVPVCNCYGLCDCADVAPRYTRCQNVTCLTYIGGPTKVCQYTP